MEKTPGFHSVPNSATSIATTVSEELIPTQQRQQGSAATQITLLQVPQLEQKQKKSVHFLATSTSTTTLPNPETSKRLRPELNHSSICLDQTKWIRNQV